MILFSGEQSESNQKQAGKTSCHVMWVRETILGLSVSLVEERSPGSFSEYISNSSICGRKDPRLHSRSMSYRYEEKTWTEKNGFWR